MLLGKVTIMDDNQLMWILMFVKRNFSLVLVFLSMEKATQAKSVIIFFL